MFESASHLRVGIYEIELSKDSNLWLKTLTEDNAAEETTMHIHTWLDAQL